MTDAPVKAIPEDQIPSTIPWDKVTAVTFYSVCVGLVTLLLTWGGSETVAWMPGLKAACVAAAGYAGGKLHR